MTNDRVIKSYVWHNEQCFFVSTIERDSSAMGGPRRYNETMVWEFDWKTKELGRIVHQDEDCTHSIYRHQSVVQKIYTMGLKFLEEE